MMMEAEIKVVRDNAAREIAEFKEAQLLKENDLKSAVKSANDDAAKARADYDALVDAKRIAEARVKALGGLDRDLTDKESFNELEREFNAFRALYKEQWAKTKRQIRKNHINLQNIKGQTDHKNDSE